jgi:predicted dehydrogenase
MPTGPALRTLVVGAGLMGRWHADAIQRTGGTLAGIVDPGGTQAAALARAHHGARSFRRLDEALEQAAARVVHVCAPLAAHEQLARTALEAGCHVLVEKPIANGVEATRRLFALASERGLLLCPVHQFLFQPGMRKAERALEGLGALRHVEMEICSAGAEASPMSRDDIAMEILPHALAFAARLCPASIAGGDWIARRPYDGELVVVATVGHVGIWTRISMNGRPPVNRLRIIAERGTITLDLFHGFSNLDRFRSASSAMKVARPFLSAARMGGSAGANLAWRALRRESAYPGLRELVKRFHAAARDGGPSPVSPDETRDVMDVWERLR